MNLAVLASGHGSNLQAIIDACENGLIPARIRVVISDKKSAYALQRAKDHNIPSVFVSPKDYPSRETFDAKLAEVLKEYQTDLVVCAGYMRIIGEPMLTEFKGRIMNIHPSLLPSFPGTGGIKDAYDNGVRVTGVTVHFVDAGMDTGPIILQEAARIEDGETLDSLEEKIHKIEHKIFTEAIKLFVEGKLSIEGRKVTIRR